MPTASRQVRKVRRLKRERSLAFKSLREMIGQFEKVREYAQGLRRELDLRDAQISQGVHVPELEGQLPAKSLTITRLDEPEENLDHLYDNNGNLLVGV